MLLLSMKILHAYTIPLWDKNTCAGFRVSISILAVALKNRLPIYVSCVVIRDQRVMFKRYPLGLAFALLYITLFVLQML